MIRRQCFRASARAAVVSVCVVAFCAGVARAELFLYEPFDYPVDFLDDAGEELDYSFEFSELRHSAGVSARILLPLGLLRLSYGVPINPDDNHPNRFLRDDIERFQIAIGVSF